MNDTGESNAGSTPPPARPRLAMAMLILVCVIWAGAFVGLEIGPQPLQALDSDHPFTVSAFFLASRFALAALLLPLVLPRVLKHVNRRNILAGLALGPCFAFHLLTQMVGLSFPEMEPGKAAFLTALFVVFAPLFAFLLLGRKPRLGVLIGIPLAAIGAVFIDGVPEGGLTLAAWLNIVAAALYGLQIVVTDVVTRKGDPLAQTWFMILCCAVICTVGFGLAPGAGALASNPGFAGALLDARFWGSELYLALISTVIALALVNRWQREVSPNHAAILFTSTPVFATLFSLVAGEEQGFSRWLVFGAAMILLANLSAEFIGRKQPH
jgi:drug/metabolite transporter (DMT)-like permease